MLCWENCTTLTKANKIVKPLIIVVLSLLFTKIIVKYVSKNRETDEPLPDYFVV